MFHCRYVRGRNEVGLIWVMKNQKRKLVLTFQNAHQHLLWFLVYVLILKSRVLYKEIHCLMLSAVIEPDYYSFIKMLLQYFSTNVFSDSLNFGFRLSSLHTQSLQRFDGNTKFNRKVVFVLFLLQHLFTTEQQNG